MKIDELRQFLAKGQKSPEQEEKKERSRKIFGPKYEMLYRWFQVSSI